MVFRFHLTLCYLVIAGLYAFGSDPIVRISDPAPKQFTTAIPADLSRIKIEAIFRREGPVISYTGISSRSKSGPYAATVEKYRNNVIVVKGSIEIVGHSAAGFLTKWRSLDFNDEANLCDPQPGYRISFYRKDKLFSVAEICFDCGNIQFRQSSTGDTSLGQINFDKSKTSKALRSYLANLFPGHDPDASKP